MLVTVIALDVRQTLDVGEPTARACLAVLYNLPGTKGYQLGLKWVMKVRFGGHLACEIYVYADNGRVTGHCRKLCWEKVRRFILVCSKRVFQDATKKRAFPADNLGPWTGTVCPTSGGGIIDTVSREKWKKAQLLVGELAEMVEKASVVQEQECKTSGRTRIQMTEAGDFSKKAKVSQQQLLEIRGFLNHMVCTYNWITPYMKGTSQYDRQMAIQPGY